MPGLVNAHTHGHGNLVKGSGDRWTLETLLNAGPYLTGNRVLEDKYLSCLLGGLDMIRSGCTACYDLFYEFPVPSLKGLEAAARGYRDAGLRVLLAPMVADHSFYEAIDGILEALPPEQRKAVERFRLAPAAETLAALEGVVKGWSFDPLDAGIALAPTIPLHCSDSFMLACRDLARDAGLGLHMHLAESKVQAVAGLRRYGKTLTAHLADIGFLASGFTAAHAVWLDPDDIARLADHGASVAHNPGSNLRLGSGVAPAREMRAAGLNVGIGTDGPHCADNQNMFEAMRLASFVSRIRSLDPQDWLSTTDVL
ncbi:MAG: amidohydrolase family protein, partial [Acetobacteraceae bacterium]